MSVLAAYDVSDDGRRSRIAAILLDYGSRVQESVFWLDIDEELSHRMVQRLRSAMNEEEDVLGLVPVCGRCSTAVKTMGRTKKPELPEFWVL